MPCATKLSSEYITCVNEHYTIHERKSHSQNAVQLALPGPFQFSSLSLLREDASRTNLVPFRLAWNPVSSTLFRNAFALNTQSTFTFVHFLAPKFGTQFVSDFCAWFVNHWIRSVRFVYDTNWRRRLQNVQSECTDWCILYADWSRDPWCVARIYARQNSFTGQFKHQT